MEATTAHHGGGKNKAKATGAERGVSKARASKEKFEMAGAETAGVRAVEKAAVAKLGKRSTAAPFARALEKGKSHV
jgi:hypothetical protein